MNLIDELIITNCPRSNLRNQIIVNENVISDIRNIMESYLINDFSMTPLTEIKQAIQNAFLIRQITTEREIQLNTAVGIFLSESNNELVTGEIK